MRTAEIYRKTNETIVKLSLNLDGTGQVEIDTGIGFLDHMLHQVAVHGLFDLSVQASGDLHGLEQAHGHRAAGTAAFQVFTHGLQDHTLGG